MRRLHFILFASMCSPLAVGCDDGLDEATVATLRQSIAESIAAAEALDQGRVRALRELASGPAPAATRCNRSVILTNVGDAPPAGFVLDNANGNVAHVELADLGREGKRLRKVRSSLDAAGDQLEPGGDASYTTEDLPALRQRIESYADPSWFRYEITVFEIDRVDPHMVGASTFEAGHVAGRVAVYDYQSQSVLCSAEVRASSRESQEVAGNGSAADRQQLLELTLGGELRSAALAAVGLRDAE